MEELHEENEDVVEDADDDPKEEHVEKNLRGKDNVALEKEKEAIEHEEKNGVTKRFNEHWYKISQERC